MISSRQLLTTITLGLAAMAQAEFIPKYKVGNGGERVLPAKGMMGDYYNTKSDGYSKGNTKSDGYYKGKGYSPTYSKGKGVGPPPTGKGIDPPPPIPPPPPKGKGIAPTYLAPVAHKGKRDSYHDMVVEYIVEPPSYAKGKGYGKGSWGKGKGGSWGKKGKKDDDYDYDGYGKGKGYYKGKGKGVLPPPVAMPSTIQPTLNETMPPVSSNSSMDGPDMPPPPTLTPGGNRQQGLTDSPTAAGETRSLRGFQISYTLATTLTGNNMPKWIESAEATEAYIDNFFATNFGAISATNSFAFDKAITTLVGGDNDVHRYRTVLHFFPSSAIPSDESLDNAIAYAFTTEESDYLTWLSDNLSNEYGGTTDISFAWTETRSYGDDDDDDDSQPAQEQTDTTTGDVVDGTPDDEPKTTAESSESSESSDGSDNTATIAAAAAAAGIFSLLVGGLIIRRRGRRRVDDMGKFVEEDGHITLAETYAGDTYATEPSKANNEAVMGPTTTTTSSVGDPHHDDAYDHHNDDASVKSTQSAGPTDWNDFQRVIHPDPMSHPEYDNMSEALSRGRSGSETYQNASDFFDLTQHQAPEPLHEVLEMEQEDTYEDEFDTDDQGETSDEGEHLQDVQL
eukprot:CAMPEP_0168819198 /NCGR_PEP_ID=MMETSP0726-20121227/8168_1 /TAXON_ID=265536 /ORGANISM="Amphiprora sp., Strain CCMP467" /LENGTH=620 /DNA_ID=CAMNT_0008871587 /DNA_START=102 /DNA_END=1964 /DNA_ORIENTATION=+